MGISFLRNWIPATDATTLTVALSIRLVLAPFTGHPFDLPIWFKTGKLVFELKSPFETSGPIGYAGIWPLWLGASFAIASSFFAGNGYVYTLLIKLPIIFADFAIPSLLVNLLGQIRPSIQLDTLAVSRLSRSYLLNPFVILAGAVWGMPDNIIAAGVLLALLKITEAKSSGTLLALSALVKPYPLIFLPPVLRYLKGKVWEFAIPLFVILGLGLTVPVILLHGNPVRLLDIVLSQTSRFPNAISPSAIFANLGSLYPGLITSQQILDTFVLPWPMRYLWLEALAALTVLLILLPKPVSMIKLIAWLRIFAVSYYLLFAAVSEQTLLPFLILCMVDADSIGRFGKRSTYWLLSILVTAFVVLNVPIWRFLYPIADITISGPSWDTFQGWGLIMLRIIFVLIMLRDARISWRIAGQTRL